MPQLGETVAEGKITKWFVSAGAAVKPGDNLFEIETDKVSMEVPSTTTGVLAEIRVVAGEVAPVGAVVGVISDGSGATASAPAAAAPRARRVPPAAPAAPAAAMPVASAQQRHATRIAPDQARSVLRSAHAGAQLRAGALVRRRHRHAAGAAACRRGRYRSFAPARLRPAWPHRRQRHRGSAAAVARAVPRGRRRRDQGALRAGQLRGSAARRHAPHHRDAADAGRRPFRTSISPPTSKSTG